MRVRAVLIAIAASLLVTSAVAQPRLVAGGSRSNYGASALSGGFEPDPASIALVSGGNLSVRATGIGPACVGFAMARPDYFVRYSEPAEFLRFYVTAHGGDTTLVIRTPGRRWLCDDDSGRGNNPRVDIEGPLAGTYEIWVGSYRAEQNLSATLFVTGSRED